MLRKLARGGFYYKGKNDSRYRMVAERKREGGVNYFNDDLSATSNNVSVELRGSEEITKKRFIR